MSQSGSQGASVGSYYKTEIFDPISSTTYRSLYQLPVGVSVNTKKIRLLNAHLLKKDRITGALVPHLFGLGGFIECISKIAVLSRNGVEIDRINGQALRYCGMKNCIVPNGSQYALSKVLNQNLDLSVIAPDFNFVQNGNSNSASGDDYWDVNKHSLTISISGMLQYLGVCRSVDNTGLQILVEWNLEKMSNLEYVYEFDNYPQIAYDVYLDATKPDPLPPAQGYLFYTMVQDTIPMASATKHDINLRLTAYVKQYIANMYYMVASATEFWNEESDLGLITRTTGQLTEAGINELFQLTLDGKTLYSRQGISSSAMKQQFFNDYMSEGNIPVGANTILNAPLGFISDGKVSFGVAPINRFIASELTLQYRNDKLHLLPTYFITIAEILRSYSPQSDMTSFVAPPQALSTFTSS
jgi:hypothetical protein